MYLRVYADCVLLYLMYITYNNPQSAYAQHILHNRHEYGPIDLSMTILKPLNDTTLLTPYEQYFIQTLHQDGQLIPEQFAGGGGPSSACHWPRLHTTRRNNSSLSRLTVHIVLSCRSPSTYPPQQVCTFPIRLTLHNSPHLLITVPPSTITLSPRT